MYLLCILSRLLVILLIIGFIGYFFFYRPIRNDRRAKLKERLSEAKKEQDLLNEINKEAAKADVGTDETLRKVKRTRKYVSKFEKRDL